MDAYNKMESVEQFARVALYTRLLGGPRLLERGQVERLEALRTRYGLAGKQMGCSRCAGDCGPSRGTAPAAAQSSEAATGASDETLEAIAAQVLRSLFPGRRG
jgi:hypothetical protein